MGYRQQVFPITSCLWLGPFASPARCSTLVAGGVTHVLNVGEAPNVLTVADGPFREVVWHPITDLELIPDKLAIECMESLHRMICEPEARVYVHCIAGWNRSPTIVWLYLVACGLSPEEAKHMIQQRAWDAVPGHARLVDPKLVSHIQAFGAGSFQPHPRPEVLQPAVVG